MRGFLGLCSGVCFGGTRFGQSRMILILCMLGFWMIYSSGVRAMPGPSPPAPCGTLDLMSPLTQHCFPEDGMVYRSYLISWYQFIILRI